MVSYSYGPQFQSDGCVVFRLFADKQPHIDLVLKTKAGEEIIPMKAQDGWHRSLPLDVVAVGTLYRFRLPDGSMINDPASRFQPQDILGPSQLVDTRGFAHKDGDWHGVPRDRARIYQLHIGTFSPEGTYQGVIDRLDHIKARGFSMIQLLPLADFNGERNWGYDGALPYAPDHSYGTPEQLRALIAACHAKGIGVVMDVVYNHFGPVGNHLPLLVEKFAGDTKSDWGPHINFSVRPMRDFFIENALYWLNEYQVDGLRFDAVHQIHDENSPEHFLVELGRRIRESVTDREVLLILENEHIENELLQRDGNKPRLFDAQLGDFPANAWRVAISGIDEGYFKTYAQDPLRRFVQYTTYGLNSDEPMPADAQTAHSSTHDGIGNTGGERWLNTVSPERARLTREVVALSPHIPHVFMGDEWGAKTPWHFFVDYSAAPKQAHHVREGRAREFENFSHAQTMPDPNAMKTLVQSRLDWEEPEQSTHRAIMAHHDALIAARKEHIEPLMKKGFVAGAWGGAADEVTFGPTKEGLDLRWQAKNGQILQMLVNTGLTPLVADRVIAGKPVWGDTKRPKIAPHSLIAVVSEPG